jgi:hypothetical protein
MSDDLSEKLVVEVKKIEDKFISEINDHFKASMRGGQWCHFHNDMVEVYSKGVKLCQTFYENRDSVLLIKNLIDCGFDGSAFVLKPFVLDNPEALSLIIKLEEDWLVVSEEPVI